MKFYISGHENMMATHHSTFEFTKDDFLTKKGDCIIGINADFLYEDIMELIEKDEIIITISIDDLKETIQAKINKEFNHKHELVIRKKDFLSDRTLAINADKAAIDINRKIIEKLKNPDTKALVEKTKMKKTLKNKEVKEFIKKITELYGLELSKKDKYEIQDNIVLINGKPMFFYYKEKIIPTLKLVLENNFLKKITIDMGAVPYAAKGADMMRPGITNIEDNIENNDVVAIVDETHSKSIALGIAMFSGPEIKEMQKGKVIKNIHYIGDDIWKFD